MIRVLVFPCGSEIGLEVHNALKYDKHIELYGLSSVPSHGRFVYKNYIEGISFISSRTFIDELNSIIIENKIDVLVPAYDDVIAYLSENSDNLKCKLVTSKKATCRICRSKLKTYKILGEYDFIPRVYKREEISDENLPLFAKPDIGQGSQGIKKIENLNDLNLIEKLDDEYVICEYLPGKEYTIDCFTDSNGKLLVTAMRERCRIKTGISVNTVSINPPEEVIRIAEVINKKLEFNGVWFFQVKIDACGRYKLLEIAPRVAGSMSASRVRGFNFILNSIYQTMGYDVKPIANLIKYSELDRALACKYYFDIEYEYVYIDFDDTITLGGQVNPFVMAFLYQSENQKKKIVLLTRHENDIMVTLEELHIPEKLFYDIVCIEKRSELKSKYIKENKAIFIDDSFKERQDVSENCHIPVFDVDCIEALIDWRL